MELNLKLRGQIPENDHLNYGTTMMIMVMMIISKSFRQSTDERHSNRCYLVYVYTCNKAVTYETLYISFLSKLTRTD
jgi:hypothetical protein